METGEDMWDEEQSQGRVGRDNDWTGKKGIRDVKKKKEMEA